MLSGLILGLIQASALFVLGLTKEEKAPFLQWIAQKMPSGKPQAV